MSIKVACAVMVGGALGSLLRLCFQTIGDSTSAFLPWGTIVANAVGSMIAGIFLSQSHLLPPEWRSLIIVGFLGGLTTMSTFATQSISLAKEGDWLRFSVYWLIGAVGCLVMVLLGLQIGRRFG